MPSPRWIVPAVAAAVLGVAATGCSDQSDAARVGDQTLSSDDLIDEVETIAGNDDLVAQLPASPDGEMRGSYSQDFVGQVLERRVAFMIYQQIADQEEIEATAADRSQAEQYWASGQTEFGPAYDAFPDGYKEKLLDEVAVAVAVQNALGQSVQTEFVELAGDVEVAPRYGSWDAESFAAQGRGIALPNGPLAAPGTGG